MNSEIGIYDKTNFRKISGFEFCRDHNGTEQIQILKGLLGN